MFKTLAAVAAALLVATPALAAPGEPFDPIGVPERAEAPIGGLVQTFPASIQNNTFGEMAEPSPSTYDGSFIVYLAGEWGTTSTAPLELMADEFTSDSVLTVQQAYQLSRVFSQIEDYQGGLLNGAQLVDPDAAVAAVPEPHEWAMIAAGMGVVGFVASRRRQKAVL